MAIAATFPAASARPSSRRPARSAQPTGPSSRPGVRLTARGRLTLLVASSALLFLVVMFSGHLTADADTGAGQQARATGVVVVQPGETLWQIAQDVAPNSDPRETVTLIRTLNNLGATSIFAGQSIVVPVPGPTSLPR